MTWNLNSVAPSKPEPVLRELQRSHDRTHILAVHKLVMTGRFAPLLFRESVLRVKGERKGVQEGGQPTT